MPGAQSLRAGGSSANRTGQLILKLAEQIPHNQSFVRLKKRNKMTVCGAATRTGQSVVQPRTGQSILEPAGQINQSFVRQKKETVVCDVATRTGESDVQPPEQVSQYCRLQKNKYPIYKSFVRIQKKETSQ